MRHLPERAVRAGQALVELGGSASPGDVGRKAGLDHNGQARALRDLEAAGMVTRTKATVELTSEGWDRFLERPRPDAGVLDEALALWPYRHRAFVDLLISATIARRHLVEHHDPHVGFMAIGNTGSGKSAMFDATCHLFGLDPVEHTLFLAEQTEGAVAGRREQGPDGWRFTPAPAMALPLVLFDEFDKGDDAVRRAVLPYFQGRLEVVREGQRFRYAPTPMLASNPPKGDRYGQLRGEYRRRAVVLDTGARAPADLETGLRAFYADPRWRGLLRLDELVPPARELPDGLRTFLGTLVNLLTPAGVEYFAGARALELVVLGRAAFLGGDLVAAAIAVAHDYVACAESIPELVLPEWHVELEALRGKVGPDVDLATLDEALARRRAEETAAARSVRAVRRAEQAEDLELVRKRAELVAMIRGAHDDLDGRRVPKQHRVEAAGVRAQLVQLREPAGQARSWSRLDEIRELAIEPLRSASELRARIDREKAAEEQRIRQERELAKAARQRHPSAHAGPSREQKAQWVRQLDAVRQIARPLEKLYNRRKTKEGERPLAELLKIRINGHPILEWEAPAPTPPRPKKWYERLSGPEPPRGWWRSTVEPAVAFPGTAARCVALESWGSNTRAVIAPALGFLHDVEDQLVGLLGRAPRRGRPELGRRANVVQMHSHPQAALRQMNPGPWGPPAG